MERGAVEIPAIQQLDTLAYILCPRVSVDERGVESEGEDAETKEHCNQCFTDDRLGGQPKTPEPAGDEVKLLGEGNEGEVERGEVVMEEKLASHEVEWEVMECPSDDAGANFVIESLDVVVAVITAVSLPPKGSNSLEENVNGNRRGR